MYVAGQAPFYHEIDAIEGRSHRALHPNNPFPGAQRHLGRVCQPQLFLFFLTETLLDSSTNQLR